MFLSNRTVHPVSIGCRLLGSYGKGIARWIRIVGPTFCRFRAFRAGLLRRPVSGARETSAGLCGVQSNFAVAVLSSGCRELDGPLGIGRNDRASRGSGPSKSLPSFQCDIDHRRSCRSADSRMTCCWIRRNSLRPSSTCRWKAKRFSPTQPLRQSFRHVGRLQGRTDGLGFDYGGAPAARRCSPVEAGSGSPPFGLRTG